MKVISFKICPFFQQVMAMLHARNIPHKVEYTEFDNCLFEISPNGKAPILITDSGETLFDSDAIIDYLDTAYPEVDSTVSKEQKALERAWSFQASKNYVAQCSAMRSESEASFKELTAVFKKALQRIESTSSGSSFFSGEAPGSVDMAWLPLLHRAALIERHAGYDFFAEFPNIKKWQKAVMELDVVKKSVSEDFEDVFTNFYLTEKSHLGSLRQAA